jgi:hypothetical protein
LGLVLRFETLISGVLHRLWQDLDMKIILKGVEKPLRSIISVQIFKEEQSLIFLSNPGIELSPKLEHWFNLLKFNFLRMKCVR